MKKIEEILTFIYWLDQALVKSKESEESDSPDLLSKLYELVMVTLVRALDFSEIQKCPSCMPGD